MAQDTAATTAATFHLGEGLEIRRVSIADLREQDLNAQVMQPEQFERLTANVKDRGALESVPYCAQPGGSGRIEIVSGHHRIRAAAAAGLEEIPVLVDTSELTRSQIVAKQIAHNTLTGDQDEAVLKQMIRFIDDVDDLLATGLPDDMLPTIDADVPALGSEPTAAFEWRAVTFTFLPHQFDAYHELADRLDKVDTLAVAEREQFEAFAEVVHRYGIAEEIRSSGTVVARLVEIALRELAEDSGHSDDGH